MPGLAAGAEEFAALARRLKEAGETGLRRELYKAINDAARPLAQEIGSTSHLEPYMPRRYAGVLASDLAVTVSKLTSRNPGVRLVAKGRVRRRKVKSLDAGVLSHPLFGNRKRWFTQTDGVRAGFFTGPAEQSAPQVRAAILTAMHDVAGKITKG